MRALPIDIGTIHFVGIGGIGMSGIAEVLLKLGYSVQGSDINESANTNRLKELGIKVYIGHSEKNLGKARVVVTSTAVNSDNSEVLAARNRMIPVVRRAEMLGELMRLQRRSIEGKNAKARRRLVLGLREVARGIRSHKVKMVVMANNLDEYGAIDAKLQEILDLANQEEIPVFFEFNKRKLGKAIGKSIKVAVVGVQNADGAHQQFKKLSLLSR